MTAWKKTVTVVLAFAVGINIFTHNPTRAAEEPQKQLQDNGISGTADLLEQLPSEEEMLEVRESQREALDNADFVDDTLTEDQHGSYYIDDNNVLHLMLKDMSKAEMMKTRHIIVHPCRFSYKELKDRVEQISEHYDELGMSMLSIDVKSNSIQAVRRPVLRRSSTSVSNDTEILLQSPAVQVTYENIIQREQAVTPGSGTHDSTYHSYACFAFNGDGDIGLITAAHCIKADQYALDAYGVRIGKCEAAYRDEVTMDAAFVAYDYTNNLTFQNVIQNTYKIADDGSTPRTPVVGQRVFKMGRTGISGGKVTTVEVFDTQGRPFLQCDYQGNDSDSGGIVFVPYGETGTNPTASLLSVHYGLLKDYSISTPLYKITQRFNLRIASMTFSGWQSSDKRWYYFNSSGIPERNKWLQSSGKWYHFDQHGIMQTGWETIDGKRYFFDSSGAMATYWQQQGEKHFYFGADGNMRTGWQQIGSKWYYFGSNGVMRTDWQQIGSKWYFFESSGAMVTGWKQLGNWFYFLPSTGEMLANCSYTINGKVYYFNADGHCTNP